MEVLTNGTVTSPIGFMATAVPAQIKYSDRLDLALLVSEQDCAAAGVFTQNQVAAAPVLVDQETLVVNNGRIRAIVANAGNANACTGKHGLADARLTQTAAAFELGCEADQVLLLSTGVIGVPLPMDKMQTGIYAAAADLQRRNDENAAKEEGGLLAARAIMTTDTRPKHLALQVELSNGTVTIGGMAKGAGMIHPNMATMLGVLTTDAAIAPDLLQTLLKQAVDVSFNRISVDGDTSTNDTVLLLANGASGIDVAEAADHAVFLGGLTHICTQLAQMIVRDGEGATKFAAIQVTGAASQADAHAIANTIATSPLVKTALAGSDPNWGRILAAAGRAGVAFDQQQTALWVSNPGGAALQLVAEGMPTAYAEANAAAVFAQADIDIVLSVGGGTAVATVWTTDLTHDYVTINADYRT
ncbi:MAG: bifunctional glutamate N-acetyltransferase/amino-acid acetyltransferase ArgJ [Ardenticatenaceae bacterium]|nr:bifunctional glutamate N-acetyltransferase/amino-acid acetyltransferase ArgJ [Anaerolineales bacterium]MCB8921757.1 bifunctional glutamate N-acetyltransferase/amino-acid acetyltransferase ArgJ [Ardenticatenaceae bacterium]MCB8990724.1 bifunctional glutamate N-acetyltransferase/amino-acid acetyltransferase ArgJ [Ardenticatenaceae bacterium]